MYVFSRCSNTSQLKPRRGAQSSLDFGSFVSRIAGGQQVFRKTSGVYRRVIRGEYRHVYTQAYCQAEVSVIRPIRPRARAAPVLL